MATETMLPFHSFPNENFPKQHDGLAHATSTNGREREQHASGVEDVVNNAAAHSLELDPLLEGENADAVPPSITGMAGPLLEDDGTTHFGKIVGVRRAGWGYRVIINIGTEKTKVLECFQGADFGRNAIKEWAPGRAQARQALNIGKRRPTHVESILHAVESDGYGSIRAAPVYFLVRWRLGIPGFESGPTEELLTRSEALRVLGKKLVDGTGGYRQRLLAKNSDMICWLNKCVSEGRHPDTGHIATAEEKGAMP